MEAVQQRAALRPIEQNPDVEGWLESQRQQIDAAIDAHFANIGGSEFSHSRLLDAVRYSMTAGGKRVRPALTLEVFRACGGTGDAALSAALAIECVHAFSLIHDDLPAMDNDDLRRGQPTNHKVFGEALAILAGDWLLGHAFELVGRNAQHAGPLTAALARGTLGMIGGQAADMAGQDVPTDANLVRFIHLHKTARLIQSACELGAICAAAEPLALACVSQFGQNLGLAFQIVDDVLDRTGTTAALGKRARKDAAVSKQTYPDAHGLERSRAAAAEHVRTAIAALADFGPRGQRLIALAEFVLTREK